MIITSDNYKKNTYNFNYNQTKYQSNFAKQNTAIDSFEMTSNKMKKDVSFGAFFGLYTYETEPTMPKDVHADVDADITLLTKKQINNIKRNVVFETYNLITSNYCTEEKQERLKKLMNSQYMNYDEKKYYSKDTRYYNILNLADFILNKPEKANPKLYKQFIIDSMPPGRRFDFAKGNINNKYINKILDEYLSLDEKKYPAQNILNLADHIKNKSVNDFNYEKYILACVRNDKPIMTSVISKSNELDLSKKIDKSSDKNVYEEIMESKNPEILAIFNRENLLKLSNNKKAVLNSYFSVPEHKTLEELFQWRPLFTNDNYLLEEYILPPLRNNTNFDEKTKFLNDLFIRIKESYIEKNENFNDYLAIMRSIAKKPEINFIFPQNQFDKLAKLNGFDSRNLSKEYKEDDIRKIFIDRNLGNTATETPDQSQPDVKPEKTANAAPVIETGEVFNLDDFEKVYDKMIENEKIYPQNANNSVEFILNNLPDIFLTKDNEEQYKKIVDKIKSQKRDFTLTNEMGNNLAHLAIMSENPILIELAASKNVPFDAQNKSGETAFDLIEKFGSNPKVVAATRDIRVNCPELFDMAENDIASGVKLILDDNRVDVNSRDLKTQNTPWLTGARKNAVDVMNVLKNHPELDINAVNKDGDNAGIIAAREGHFEIIKILNKLEDFDINYINPKTSESVYTAARSVTTLNAVMENKNANPNITKDGSMPPVLKIMHKFNQNKYEKSANNYIVLFYKLIENENVDLSFKYMNKTLGEYLNMYTKDTDYHNTCMDKLSEVLRSRYFNMVKNKVEQKGLLTLDEIKEFVTYPKIEDLISLPLNDMNEPVGFFLADNAINRKNIADFLNIINILKENKYDFNIKNKMGQTIMDKSKDAENEFLVEYMQKNNLINGQKIKVKKANKI